MNLLSSNEKLEGIALIAPEDGKFSGTVAIEVAENVTLTLPCDLQDTPDEVKKALQVELDNIQDKSTEELISLAQEMADFKHTVLTVLKEEDEEEIRNNLKNIHQKLVDNGEITER